MYWISTSGAPIFDTHGVFKGYRGIGRNITERKEAEEKIERLAFYDVLTDLPNRRLLMDHLQHVVLASARTRSLGALLFIDLDNFKDLNDTRGHDVGDLLLQQVAQRLKANYPLIEVRTGTNDPSAHDLVVNATPMGMNEGDPLPMDVSRLAPETFVGEVVMRTEMTAFLLAAQKRGCRVQVGSDMLFEQIPAYLEYFGLKTTTAEVLRSVARLG